MHYVYAYTRSRETPNGPIGSPYYIGKGKGRRAYAKSRSGRKPPKSKDQIVILAAGLSEEEAFALEKSLIAFYGKVSNGTGCLRNMTDGGEGISGFRWKRGPLDPEHLAKVRAIHAARRGKPGHPVHPETREKIRQSLLGIRHSKQRIEKISQSKAGQRVSMATEFKKGHKLSLEARAKLSQTLKGRTNNPLGFLGKNHTDESRAKMSEGLRAAWARRREAGTNTHKPFSEETRQRMRIAALRRYGKIA